MTDRERAALKSIRESFDAFGLPLEHMTDEDLLSASVNLSVAVSHAGLSLADALRAVRALGQALNARP